MTAETTVNVLAKVDVVQQDVPQQQLNVRAA